MTFDNYYTKLVDECKKQLNRELCHEELEFIAWISELHAEELYNKMKSS